MQHPVKFSLHVATPTHTSQNLGNATPAENAKARQARYRAKLKLDTARTQQKAEDRAARLAKAKEPETCILSAASAGSDIVTKKTQLIDEQGNLFILYLPKHMYQKPNNDNFIQAITDLQQTVGMPQ